MSVLDTKKSLSQVVQAMRDLESNLAKNAPRLDGASRSAERVLQGAGDGVTERVISAFRQSDESVKKSREEVRQAIEACERWIAEH